MQWKKKKASGGGRELEPRSVGKLKGTAVTGTNQKPGAKLGKHYMGRLPLFLVGRGREGYGGREETDSRGTRKMVNAFQKSGGRSGGLAPREGERNVGF